MEWVLWVNGAFVLAVFGGGIAFLVWKIRHKLAEVEARQDASRDRFHAQRRDPGDGSE